MTWIVGGVAVAIFVGILAMFVITWGRPKARPLKITGRGGDFE